MIHLRSLRPSTLAQLAVHLTRTPDAPAWVGETEDYILGWGPAVIFRMKAGQVLLIEDDRAVIGAAIHRPSDFQGAELLAAIMLDHRHRGTGQGENVLRAVIAEAHRASGLSYVTWLVHEDNAAMQHLSREVVGDHDSVAGKYHVFVHEL